MARITLGDAYVRVVYSRPYKRGRNNIFGTKESGAIVPYGERWRTGANEATEITVTKDVLVAGQKLAAGTYSLSTTPGAASWKVHFNSKLGLDGLGVLEGGEFKALDLGPTDVLVVNAAVPAVSRASARTSSNGSGSSAVDSICSTASVIVRASQGSPV